MSANAYRCDNCGHHESLHRHNGPCLVLHTNSIGGGVIDQTECACDGFIPGDCDRCRGWGCEDCLDGSR